MRTGGGRGERGASRGVERRSRGCSARGLPRAGTAAHGLRLVTRNARFPLALAMPGGSSPVLSSTPCRAEPLMSRVGGRGRCGYATKPLGAVVHTWRPRERLLKISSGRRSPFRSTAVMPRSGCALRMMCVLRVADSQMRTIHGSCLSTVTWSRRPSASRSANSRRWPASARGTSNNRQRPTSGSVLTMRDRAGMREGGSPQYSPRGCVAVVVFRLRHQRECPD